MVRLEPLARAVYEGDEAHGDVELRRAHLHQSVEGGVGLGVEEELAVQKAEPLALVARLRDGRRRKEGGRRGSGLDGRERTGGVREGFGRGNRRRRCECALGTGGVRNVAHLGRADVPAVVGDGVRPVSSRRSVSSVRYIPSGGGAAIARAPLEPMRSL